MAEVQRYAIRIEGRYLRGAWGVRPFSFEDAECTANCFTRTSIGPRHVEIVPLPECKPGADQ